MGKKSCTIKTIIEIIIIKKIQIYSILDYELTKIKIRLFYLMY